jgi:alpha-ketoglutarate-dependent taurine dioxygenase
MRETVAISPRAVTEPSPFSLDQTAAYCRWRDRKLAEAPTEFSALEVAIADLERPTAAETAAILERCRRANMAVYRTREPVTDGIAGRTKLIAFARHFGLEQYETHRSADVDGIVALEVSDAPSQADFIPYTTRALGWHTDGYYTYKGPRRLIRSMLLHCVRAAKEGGENAFVDHEILYIRLRDESPAFISALMHPEAMTIPAHVEDDGRERPANVGPVFLVDPDTGLLDMRFTARKRNIAWRDDATTRAAVAALERILDSDPLVLRGRLEPGQGVICNNVPHLRTAFVDFEGDNMGRLLYRIRSYDRVREGGSAA